MNGTEDFVVLEPPRGPVFRENDPKAANGANNISNENDTTTNNQDNSSGSDESSSCPICFEQWTNSGKHRLVSLKCGHLFGKGCIERWLTHPSSGSAQGIGKCPQCNMPAKRADLRVIFAAARRIAAVDNTEATSKEEALLRQLEEEKRAKRLALEREAASGILLQAARAEIINLKEEIARLKVERAVGEIGRFVLTREVSLSEDALQGNKIVICDGHYRSVLLANKCNQVIRVSLDHPQLQTLKTPHTKQIKAIATGLFNDGLFAVVSLAALLSLHSLQTGACLAEWPLPAPAWSVAFSRSDRSFVIVGLCNRQISIIDVRRTDSLTVLVVDEGQPPLPVHSLFSGHLEEQQTIVGATMSGVFVSSGFDFADSALSDVRLRTVKFPGVNGSCSGLAAASDGVHYLATYRHPSDPLTMVLFILDPTSTVRVLSVFSAASSSPRLITAALFDSPKGGGMTAALADDPSATIHLWDYEGGKVFLRDAVKGRSAANAVAFCQPHELVALSDTHLSLYSNKPSS